VGSIKIMMIFQNLVKGAVVTAFFASSVGAVDNGLAITPQMGCESFPLRISRNIADEK
jgi:hypothetical protein